LSKRSRRKVEGSRTSRSRWIALDVTNAPASELFGHIPREPTDLVAVGSGGKRRIVAAMEICSFGSI
jgi:hypothetical protein